MDTINVQTFSEFISSPLAVIFNRFFEIDYYTNCFKTAIFMSNDQKKMLVLEILKTLIELFFETSKAKRIWKSIIYC